jgi:hypothetical protein
LFIGFGVLPLTIINIVYIIFLIRMLKKSIKWTWLFAGVMATLLVGYGHIMGGIANIEATNLYLSDPEFYDEKIAGFNDDDKISHYSGFVISTIFVPYIISLIGFIIIMYLYDKRRPEREKCIDQAIKLLMKWK